MFSDDISTLKITKCYFSRIICKYKLSRIFRNNGEHTLRLSGILKTNTYFDIIRNF